jgi:hypothetical protein
MNWLIFIYKSSVNRVKRYSNPNIKSRRIARR